MTQYWHMQMHPDDQSFSEVLHSILENKKIIGLGKWAGGQVEKEDFFNRMKVNDIVAIKNEIQNVKAVASENSSSVNIVYGNKSNASFVIGTNNDYFIIKD